MPEPVQVMKARAALERAWGQEAVAKLDDSLVLRAVSELEAEAVGQPVTVLIHLPQAPQIMLSGPPIRRADRIRRLTEFSRRQQQPVLAEIERLTGGQEAANVGSLPLINVVVAQLTPEQARTLAALPEVEKIELDKTVLPDLDVSAKTVKVEVLRSLNPGGVAPLTGEGVAVAVLGRAVDAEHPDLAGRVIEKRSYGDIEFDFPDPHETLVAGIIAGDGTASGGRFVGIAPKALIWSYTMPMTPTAPGYIKAQAVLDAATDGARIINCSWRVVEGTPRDGTCAWCKAVDTATELGALVVKSAGNTGPGGGTVSCPGNTRLALTVGASSDDGSRMARNNFGAEFSSVGPTADGRPKPEVLAPGENIQGPLPGGGYSSDEYADGTSFAAPHVAGIAALLLEKFPALTPAQLRQAIVETAVRLPEAPAAAQGAGLVDAVAALRRASELLAGPVGPLPHLEPVPDPGDLRAGPVEEDGGDSSHS